MIDNAHLLDEGVLRWAIELQDVVLRDGRKEKQRKLILGTRAALEPHPTNPVARLFIENEATKRAWSERIKLDVLTAKDFFAMWAEAAVVQLKAKFDDGIDSKYRNLLIADYWKKTQGHWHAIDDLLMVFHEELGPFREQTHRVITQDVIDRVQARFSNVDWTLPDK